MKINYIKSDTIFEVEIRHSIKTSYKWKDTYQVKKGFFKKRFETIQGGWIQDDDEYPKSFEIINNYDYYILKNNEIWKKPYVTVWYSVGTKEPLREIVYFDSDEEARSWATEIISKFPYITIIDKTK